MVNPTDKEKVVLGAPDDFHHHFRDGEELKAIVPLVSRQFVRAIAMPNLVPPVTTTESALQYRKRILAAVPQENLPFEPLMTLYLTDNTTREELEKAKQSGVVFGCKMYPAHATTNSDFGVTSIKAVTPALKAMEELDLVLLVHGEVVKHDNGEIVDIFKRERLFFENVAPKLIKDFPKLRISFEHITTKDAVDFILSVPQERVIGATITPQHLMFDRNKIFEKNLIRPHNFCLPILKSKKHYEALVGIVKGLCGLGGYELEEYQKKRFFLGTDSAAHSLKNKLNKNGDNCGCAGVFSALTAIEFYLQVFEKEGNGLGVNTVEGFEKFVHKNGADFYKLPHNKGTIELIKKSSLVNPKVIFGKEEEQEYFVPFCAGEQLSWTISSISK